MPIYEYKCDDCGANSTALISVSNRDGEEGGLNCPECGGSGLKRQLSTFSFKCPTGSTDPVKPAPSAPPCSTGGG